MEEDVATEVQDAGIADGEAAAVDDEEERRREEFRLMLTGFGLGMTVGGVFLVYVVLEAAHLLS